MTIKQSGPVLLSSPRIKHDFEYLWQGTVQATVRIDVSNSANTTSNVTVAAVIESPDGQQYPLESMASLEPGEEKTVSLAIDIENPQIWWPAQWGTQPLVSSQLLLQIEQKPL